MHNNNSGGHEGSEPFSSELRQPNHQEITLIPRASERARGSASRTAMPLEDLTKRADFSKYDESVVKDMPEYPGLTLSSHVMLKMIQVGHHVVFCCFPQEPMYLCSSAPNFCAKCASRPFARYTR